MRAEADVSLVHAIPQLPTRSLERTKEWYERHLGFHAPEGWKEWKFLILVRDGQRLYFFPGDPGPDDGGTIYLEVAGGIDALAARLRAGGADLHDDPVDQPYGMREVVVHDADGRHVRIGQRVGAQR